MTTMARSYASSKKVTKSSDTVSNAARHLLEQKCHVLALWEKLARAALPSTDSKSHYVLLDSLPQFLDELISSLAINQPKLVQSENLAITHGIQRSAIRDYSLKQVITEYDLLARSVFLILDEKYTLTSHERNIIFDYIQAGRVSAAEEFTRQVLEKERETADAVRQAERQFRALANSIPQHVWITDSTGSAIWYNDKWYNYTGKNPEDVLGSSWMNLLPPDQVSEVKDKIRETVNTGGLWENSCQIKSRTGEWRWFLSRGTPIRDEQGKVTHWFGTNTDITEQKETEEELQRSKEKFRFLINSIPSIAWTAEPDGSLDFLNERFYQYTGDKPGHPLHADWNQFIHPDDFDRVKKLWFQVLEKGHPFRFEFRLKGASDGKYRWHLSNAVPVKDSQGHVIKWFGLTVDIEDQKRAQANLEEERALREFFINTLSHDLRTPLTVAKTGTELMSKNPERLDWIPKLTSRVLENLERVDRMIRDLLDINSIRSGKGVITQVDKVDLTVTFREVWEDFSTVYGDRFVFSLPKSMWGLWSKEALRRVLENLLSNAIKYGDQTRPIFVKMKEKENHCHFSVHNFGTPIAPQDQAKLFEPFVRALTIETGRALGWGIGLTLVKGVIEAHHGKIYVDSSAEGGTTFFVILPILER